MKRRSPASSTNPTAAGPPCALTVGMKTGPPLDASIVTTVAIDHHFAERRRRHVRRFDILMFSLLQLQWACVHETLRACEDIASIAWRFFLRRRRGDPCLHSLAVNGADEWGGGRSQCPRGAEKNGDEWFGMRWPSESGWSA